MSPMLLQISSSLGCSLGGSSQNHQPTATMSSHPHLHLRTTAPHVVLQCAVGVGPCPRNSQSRPRSSIASTRKQALQSLSQQDLVDLLQPHQHGSTHNGMDPRGL